MTEHFNDSPIRTKEQDKYGVLPFAQTLAKCIQNIDKPIGTTIALNGPWGSGKSSIVNLVRDELKNSGDSNLKVSEFKCWWFKGEDALALAFLQHLHAEINDTLGKKAKNLIPKLGRGLLQAGSVMSSAIALTSGASFSGLVGSTSAFIKRFFPAGETVDSLFVTLSQELEKSGRRFLIVIDDIDRLSPEEALAIFRLIKSVGHLPNVIYLLSFDRDLAEKAVLERHPSEGSHYLEKIIQAAFEVPFPQQIDLNHGILATVDSICKVSDDDTVQRVMNLFYDVIEPYINSPRHAARYQNAIRVTWPAIEDEVHIGDFLALEVLRLYEPSVYRAIRSHQKELCGTSGTSHNQRDDARFEKYLIEVQEDKHEVIKTALKRLFPSMEEVGYSGDFVSGWDAIRRVCVSEHFDTYFRLSLSSETISSSAIDEFLNRAHEPEYVTEKILEASRKTRRNNETMVPIWLSTLTSNADRIDEEKLQPLVSTLFKLHDDFDLEPHSRGGFSGEADNTLSLHWFLNRAVLQRLDLEARTELFRVALDESSLGWIVNFVSRVRGCYNRDDERQLMEDQFCTTESALPEFTENALAKIRAAAKDGSLLEHRDLTYILYRWRDFMDGDVSEVLAWTNKQLDKKEGLLSFAEQLTSETRSWGMGFDGLGDRVARSTPRAQIDDEIEILDPKLLRSGLEGLLETGELDEQAIEIVKTFLNAWDDQEAEKKRLAAQNPPKDEVEEDDLTDL